MSGGTSNAKYLVHGLRVLILVGIVCLMRLQQQRILASRETTNAPDLVAVVPVFPGANSLQLNDAGGHDVVNPDGEKLGSVVQTSPDSDHIIGFSGPTNVLIAFDTTDKIVGLHVLSSGDTRDHVQQVIDDERFMQSLNSLSADEAKHLSYDAVSGATLTSLAIREAIAFRLGNSSAKSLRFADPPDLEVVQTVFPEAAGIEEQVGSIFEVVDQRGVMLGTMLRTSPAADNIVGYQGPTDALIGIDSSNKLVGLAVGATYDNEPYVGYVREDAYFCASFNEMNLGSLANLDLMEAGVEGVSGATMTSIAVAEGVVRAAKVRVQELQRIAQQPEPGGFFSRWTLHDWGTIVCVFLGSIIGLTRLRGNRRLAVAWNLVLVVYLGLTAGSLLSQAMFVGWSGHGIPTQSAFGLICLAVAAFFVPLTTRRNLYCSHLCPHGAAQQLLRNRLPHRLHLPTWMRFMLRVLPAILLLWCVVVGMTSMGFSLVDIEPFDAWVFRIAGLATITVAVVGLVASLFVPMAYCRFGCPTGAVLEFVRFNGRAHKWTTRDWLATGCLAVAAIIYLAG